MAKCQFDPRPELNDTSERLTKSELKRDQLIAERNELQIKLNATKIALLVARREISFFKSEVKRLQAALVQYLKRH